MVFAPPSPSQDHTPRMHMRVRGVYCSERSSRARTRGTQRQSPQGSDKECSTSRTRLSWLLYLQLCHDDISSQRRWLRHVSSNSKNATAKRHAMQLAYTLSFDAPPMISRPVSLVLVEVVRAVRSGEIFHEPVTCHFGDNGSERYRGNGLVTPYERFLRPFAWHPQSCVE